MSQDEGMSESSGESLGKTLVPHLILSGGLTSLETSKGSSVIGFKSSQGLTLLEN